MMHSGAWSSTANSPPMSAVTASGGDITAVLESLQLLGAKTGQFNVHLYRSPQGGWP